MESICLPWEDASEVVVGRPTYLEYVRQRLSPRVSARAVWAVKAKQRQILVINEFMVNEFGRFGEDNNDQ